MKKTIKTLIIIILLAVTMPVFAKENALTHVNRAAKLSDKYKYTEAIKEYSKAIAIDPVCYMAKYGIILTHAEQGDICLLEDKEYGKAANHYRSILFYTLYFHPELNTENLNSKIPMMREALGICEKKLHYKNTPKNHYNTAKLLELAEEYPAAAYEYMQASKNKKLAKECNKNVAAILCKLGDNAYAQKFYDVNEDNINENKNNSSRKN